MNDWASLGSPFFIDAGLDATVPLAQRRHRKELALLVGSLEIGAKSREI